MCVCAQLFISYVCVCSVIYKLCMYVLGLLNWNVAILLFIEYDANKIKSIKCHLCHVCVQLFISYVCMLFIECDANEIKTIIMYLLFLIPKGLTLHSYTVHSFYGWILFNINSAIFQLYHGENMLMTWYDTFFWLLILIQ